MTDARAGKVGLKVAIDPNPDARVGKVGLKVAIDPNPDARVGKVGLKVLVRLPIIATADTANQLDARQRDGFATTVLYSVPVAAPPAVWTPTRSDDLALWLPPPTIVDGRIQ